MATDSSGKELQFVLVKGHDGSRSASCTATARSHVMKKLYRQQQVAAREQGANFRYVSAEQLRRRQKRVAPAEDDPNPPAPIDRISVALIDPFNTLATDTTDLATLLENPLARQAGEPVVNFDIRMGYQGLHTVFRSSVADPALLNAMLLALTYTVHKDASSPRFLSYKGETLRWINKRLQDLGRGAATPATIGAILLLTSVESRLGDKERVQAHMKGVLSLMHLCGNQYESLHGLRRAIFWQDLISAVLTGSERVLSHDTFVEFSWKRDPLRPLIFQTPIGFEASAPLLGDKFLSIIEDIKALQVIRDGADVDRHDAISIMHIDNHQASVESRLFELGRDPVQFEQPALYCCIHAAYLCAYMLFTEVWGSSLVPLRLTSELLERLQYVPYEHQTGQHWALFLWVICIGGAFAGSGGKQLDYGTRLTQHLALKPAELEPFNLQTLVSTFIWSDKTFVGPWKKFLSHAGLSTDVSI